MNESYILSLISRIHRQGNRFIESALRNEGLTDIAPSHGDILFHLYQRENLTMQELSKAIDRDKSTVTVLVDKLVKLGYIRKEQDAEDARVYRLTVTDKGRNLHPMFKEISEELLREIYKDFSLEEKRQIMDLLQKIKL